MKLALDLGLKLGYCIRYNNGVYDYGVKYLKSKDDKFNSFEKFLYEVNSKEKIDKIYYENVTFGYNTYATQSWGGLKAILLNFCDKNNIYIEGFEVSTVKKKFTGHGNASKMGMVHYAEKWIGEEIKDDNEADAIAVMYCGRNGVK